MTPEILDQLVRQYRDEGLPVPPADAPLVLIPTGGGISKSDEDWTPAYVLGFRLKGDDPARPGSFLIGTETHELTIKEHDESPPLLPVVAGEPLKALLAEPSDLGTRFHDDTWLAIAVQCWLRGEQGITRQIVERGLHVLPKLPGDIFLHREMFTEENGWPDLTAYRLRAEQEKDGDPRKALAATAWGHWIGVTLKPGTDRREALVHLEKLLMEYPALDSPSRREFIEALRLTVQPGKGAAGSAEALIDGLTDLPGNEEETFSHRREQFPDYRRLGLLGFAAMPVLIEHVDDPRLTRLERSPMGYSPLMRQTRAGKLYTQALRAAGSMPGTPPVMLRVGDLVTPLALAMVGGTIVRGWSAQQPESSTYKQLARRWWEETAPKMSEEEYVTTHVLPLEGVQRGVNTTCLQIVAERFPQHLGGLYEQVLSAHPAPGNGVPDVFNLANASREIVEAIRTCAGLGHDEKLRLLHAGAESADLSRREDALAGLLQLDPVDGEARLVKELDALPKDATRPYNRSPIVEIVTLVRRTGAPTVWLALERAARRASVTLRMELLSAVNNRSVPDNPREAERVRLLGAFLDDDEVRILSPDDLSGNRLDGPVASQCPRISVQNFAASEMHSAVWMGGPEWDWDETRWARYRAMIREALARYESRQATP